MIANQSGTITLLFKTTQAYKKNNKKKPLFSPLLHYNIFKYYFSSKDDKKGITLYLLVFDCRPLFTD